jgi:hypothetical protein
LYDQEPFEPYQIQIPYPIIDNVAVQRQVDR